MKKLYIIIGSIILGAGILCGIIFLCTPKAQPKISNTNIVFAFEETENFYSNQKANNTFNYYNLTITNTKSVDFKNPIVEPSTNIDATIQTYPSQILINFKIKFGEIFSFKLTSDNFETITESKTAIEYVQKDNMILQVATTSDGNYVDLTNQTLYLIENQFKNDAFQAGYFYEYFIKGVNLQSSASQFDISVAESGCLNYDNNTKKLTAISEGNSKVTIEAKDGSGAKREFTFPSRYVKATSVSNLPESISLDVNTDSTKTLSPQPNPTFAQNATITFATDNNAVFDVSNFTLNAVAKGNANLIVKLNDVQIAIIPVAVTAPSEPCFAFSLQTITTNTYGDNISFNNNVCTLSTETLSGNATLNFNINYENLGLLAKPTYEIVSDSNSIKKSCELGIGSTSALPFLIVVDTNKTGSIVVKFTGNTQAGTIENTITIVLE